MSIIIMPQTFALIDEETQKEILKVATIQEIEETGIKYIKLE